MIKTCAVCGKEFETLSSREAFCSQACRLLRHKELQREYYPVKFKRERIAGSDTFFSQLSRRRLNGETICMWCERPLKNPQKHFCCDDCTIKFYAQIFSSLTERGY